MPRKYVSTERFLKADPVFGSRLVSKFTNCLMERGKKTVAERIFYAACDEISRKVKDVSPLDVFTQAVENVKPLIEVRSKRVGGATYQVPMEVRRNRQQSLAFRWLLLAARKKKGRPMALRLADEILAAYKREGEAITTRENVHKMAEANKAFAHFAW
jgi:small subunit ribosomal protein S7